MPQRLTDVELDEVSLVDSPANKHAKVVLFKRAAPTGYDDGNYPSSIHKREFTDEERKDDAKSGAAMPGGGFPIEDEGDLKNAIRAIGRAKDPGKTKAHIRSRAKALGLEELLPESWSKRDSGVAVIKALAKADAKAAEIAKGYGDGEACTFDEAQVAMEESEAACGLMDEVNEAVCALGSAVWSIQADDTISDKGEAIQESLNQFGEHVKTVVPEGVENALVAQALADAGYAINAKGGIELSKRGDSMSLKAIAKSLGLQEDATEAQILEKMAANAAAAPSPMTADDLGYVVKLNPENRVAFALMKADDRKKKMKDFPNGDDDDEDDVEKAIKKGDAFRTPEGSVVLRKSAGSMFDVMKGMNERAIKAEKSAAEAKDMAEEKDRKDKAEKGLSLIGKADEVGSVLFQIAKHDPKLADKVEAMLKSANDALAKSEIFKEHGSGHAVTGSAADMINKGAQDLLSKEPALKTIEKARTEFRKRNPEIRKREEDEAAKARKAA